MNEDTFDPTSLGAVPVEEQFDPASLGAVRAPALDATPRPTPGTPAPPPSVSASDRVLGFLRAFETPVRSIAHQELNALRVAGSDVGAGVEQALSGAARRQQIAVEHPSVIDKITSILPGAFDPYAAGLNAAPEGIKQKGADIYKSIADYFGGRAKAAPAESGVDPELESSFGAKAAHTLSGLGVILGEASIPAVGVPLLLTHNALQRYGETFNETSDPQKADRAAAISVLGNSLFMGQGHAMTAGLEAVLPKGLNAVAKWATEASAATGGNIATSQIIKASEAASQAEPGKRMEEFTRALSDVTAGDVGVAAGFGAWSASAPLLNRPPLDTAARDLKATGSPATAAVVEKIAAEPPTSVEFKTPTGKVSIQSSEPLPEEILAQAAKPAAPIESPPEATVKLPSPELTKQADELGLKYNGLDPETGAHYFSDPDHGGTFTVPNNATPVDLIQKTLDVAKQMEGTPEQKTQMKELQARKTETPVAAPEPAASAPPTPEQVAREAYVPPTPEEKAARVEKGSTALREQMRKTGVAPAWNEVRKAVGNEAASDLYKQLQIEIKDIQQPEKPLEGAKVVNETHPLTGDNLPSINEGGKIRPMFTNDPEITAQQIDIGQRVYPPEEMVNNNQINPAIHLDYDPKTESDYVTSVDHSKYGSIESPDQFSKAYREDPDVAARREAQTKGRPFFLTQEGEHRASELATRKPYGGSAEAEADKLIELLTPAVEQGIRAAEAEAVKAGAGVADESRIGNAVREQLKYELRFHPNKEPEIPAIINSIKKKFISEWQRNPVQESLNAPIAEGVERQDVIEHQPEISPEDKEQQDAVQKAMSDAGIRPDLIKHSIKDVPPDNPARVVAGSRATGDQVSKNLQNIIKLGMYDSATKNFRPLSVILKRMSIDPNFRESRRLLARVMSNSNIDFNKVNIELVNYPNAGWTADYAALGDGTEGRVRLNVGTQSLQGLGGSLLHELLHHATLMKLAPGYIRNPIEQGAYDNLKKLHNLASREIYKMEHGKAPTDSELADFQRAQDVRSNEPEKPMYNRSYYGLGSLDEFVSESLTNPVFSQLLDTIPEHAEVPSGGSKFKSILESVRRYLVELFKGVRTTSGSLLDQAIHESLTFALHEPFDPARAKTVTFADVVAASRKPPKDYRIRLRFADGGETIFGTKGPILSFPDEIPGTPKYKEMFSDREIKPIEEERAGLEAAISGEEPPTAAEQPMTRQQLEELALRSDPEAKVMSMTSDELRLAAGLDKLPGEISNIDGPGWLAPNVKFTNVEGGALFGTGAHERTALAGVISKDPALKKKWDAIEKKSGGASSYDVINKFMEDNGFVRVADTGGREIYISGKPTPAQMRALQDAAIERGAELWQDKGGLKGKLLYSPGNVLSPAAAQPPPLPTLEYRKGADKLISTANSVNNTANIYARQMASDTALDFGKNDKPTEQMLQDRRALPFVVEAGGDREELVRDLNRVSNSKDSELAKEWTPVVQHALDNFDRLQPIAEKYSTRMKELLQRGRDNGLTIGEIENYVTRLLDLPENERELLSAPKSGGGSRYFTKGRTEGFEKLSDAINAGYAPRVDRATGRAGDIVDLTRTRAEAQERLVQMKLMKDEFKNTLATDGRPIISEPEEYKATGGKTETRSPRGYDMVPTGGAPLIVHQDYAPLFRALFADGSAGGFVRALNVYAGWTKRNTLILDTYHVGRILFKELSYSKGAQRVGWNKGLSILEYSDANLDRAVQSGDISQRMADFSRERLTSGLTRRDVAELLVKHGLNVGRMSDNFFAEHASAIPGIKNFNPWVFQKLSRGAMLQTGIENFERNMKRFPERGEDGNARQTAKEYNEVFGNLQKEAAGIFKDKRYQDIARALLLAPNWAESQLRAELRGYGQLARAPIDIARGRGIGTVAQGQLTAVLGMLAANQIINLITTGHSTFQNKEGHLMDAFIPGGKAGFWFNPFEIGAEYAFMAHRYFSRHMTSVDVISQIAQNKLGSVGRGIKTFLTGRDYAGRSFASMGDRITATITDALPFPLPLSGLVEKDPRVRAPVPGYRLSRQPGASEKQLLQSAGLKVAAELTPRAEMFALAHPFRQDKSYLDPGGTGSEYIELRRALDNNQLDAVKTEIRGLVDRGKTWKEIRASVGIGTSGNVSPELFTGRKENERLLKQSLTADQLDQYKQAQRDHRDNANKLRRSLADLRPELEAKLAKNKKPLRGEVPSR